MVCPGEGGEAVLSVVESWWRRRQWHPLQYSCLENAMDGGAWWAAVHGVAKTRTQLSDFTFTFHFHALEKEMATHSSVLAWRIPGTGEPGGLPSMGWHRVGHDWSDLVAESWRRRKKYEWKDQPRLPCGGWMSALPDKHLRSYQWIERDQETEKKI